MEDAEGSIYTFEQILLLERSFDKFDQEMTIWLSTLGAIDRIKLAIVQSGTVEI